MPGADYSIDRASETTLPVLQRAHAPREVPQYAQEATTSRLHASEIICHETVWCDQRIGESVKHAADTRWLLICVVPRGTKTSGEVTGHGAAAMESRPEETKDVIVTAESIGCAWKVEHVDAGPRVNG